MRFIQRLSLYFSGLLVGVVFLIFFFSGKKTSCDYGPNARVLKNINSKKIYFDWESEIIKNKLKYDSLKIMQAIKYGNVNFKNSNTKQDSCNIYNIEDKFYTIILKNCPELVKIISINTKN